MKKVCTVETEVSIHLPVHVRNKVFMALNQHHYGSETIQLDAVNIPKKLVDSHYNVGMSRRMIVVVDVYEDGSMDMKFK